MGPGKAEDRRKDLLFNADRDKRVCLRKHELCGVIGDRIGVGAAAAAASPSGSTGGAGRSSSSGSWQCGPAAHVEDGPARQ